MEEKVPWSARVFGDTPPTDAADATSVTPEESGKVAPTEVAETSTTTAAAAARIHGLIQPVGARQLSAGLINENAAAAAQRDRAKKFGASALGVVGAGAKQVWGLVLGSIELGLLVFLVPFYFFYFATTYPRVLRFGEDFIPDHNRDRIEHLIREMDRAVAGFVRGRLVISAILGTIFAIGWLIVGVPYSLALGLLVGVFCAVPYLSVIGVPVAVTLLAVDQFSLPESERMVWWGIVVWPTAVYMVGQTLDDWVLTPLIQGKVTNLNPVAIVVAVLAGGTLAGIYGMLLAVPAAACVKIILSEVVMPRIQAWRKGRAVDPLPVG
jgi:predicted PurR-regulated permease PerM